MPHGEDKGYDIFIDAARILAQQRDDVRFHVVGNYDESIVDITGLENRITFYGMQPLPFFDKFYRDKDILISPNRSGVLDKGAFDGFPTGCAVDALVRETAIFCTDNAGNGQNCGQYENGKEIVLTTSNAESIAQQVNQYASNPARLKSLCELGAKKPTHFIPTKTNSNQELNGLRKRSAHYKHTQESKQILRLALC